MRRGRVTHAYTTQYPDPITIHAGETLALGRQDSEWPGWTWCVSPQGKSGWVPEGYIERRGEAGVALRDYTARELTVSPGDRLDLHMLESGWYWATDAAGQSGWVPERDVEVLRDSE